MDKATSELRISKPETPLDGTSSRWRRFRIALMCLLATAMPLQGLAAVMMVACGPSHHRVAQSGAEDASHAGHSHAHGHAHEGTMPRADDEHRHHAGDPATHQESGSAQPPVDGSLAGPEVNGMDELHEASQSKCSACASCCTSAVLPAALLAFDAPTLADNFPPPMPWLVAAFLTDGQERPPRTFLA